MDGIAIRFYQELNDFLQPDRRKSRFTLAVAPGQTVKDAIEACGVPHPEVDLILVNGNSKGFDYRLEAGDDVSVYPVFESFDVRSVTRLTERPLRRPCFRVDENLGKLARLLRLAGIDTHMDRLIDDAEVVRRANAEGAAILTRDRGLLMRKSVIRGYYVRSTDPQAQLKEVVDRFDLSSALAPLTRCPRCNGRLRPADSDEVSQEVPPGTRASIETFSRCTECGRTYWKGAHWSGIRRILDGLAPS